MPDNDLDQIRAELGAIRTQLAVAETVIAGVKSATTREHDHRVEVSEQLAVITERLAVQQRIVWGCLAVIVTEGAAMVAYALRAVI